MESLVKNPYRRLMENYSMRESAGQPSDTKNNMTHAHPRAGSPVFSPTTFDTNIIIVTAALLMVLICALGMNAFIKCILNCTRRLGPHQQQETHHSFRRGINKAELKLLPTTIYHHSKPLMPSNTQKAYNTSINGAHNISKESGSDCKAGSPHLRVDDEGHHVIEDDDQDCLFMQDSQCPICLTDFQDGEKIRVLPMCNHGFHMQCVDSWLCNHSSCPVCRADLTPNISNAIHNNPILHAQRAHMQMKKSTQVQLEILISPGGTLTPTIYRVLPTSSASSLQRLPNSTNTQ